MKITVDGERKLAYFPQTEGASTMPEEYDKAIDSALERNEDPEAYLRFKTCEDEFQKLLERCYEAVKRGAVAVVLLLLLLSSARADSLDVISGTLTGIPGDTLTYNLTVQTTIKSDFGGFVLDTMSGTVVQVFSDGFVSTENFGGDLYAFGLNETSILAEFGIYAGEPPILSTGYDFLGTATGVSILFVDPPAFSAATATPEPQVWYMILAGIALVILFFPKGKKEYRRY